MAKLLGILLGLWALIALTYAEPQFVYTDESKIHKGANHKTLRPAIHWDHDHSDLTHLVPSKTIGIYYTENGRARPQMAHQFTHMNSDLEYPGVVLEHSQYVDKVVCHPNAMRVHFNSRKAWAVVQKTWNATGGFTLVEHSSGCGEDQTGQKVYWLAKSVTFNNDAMVAHINAREMEVQHALAKVRLEVGMWQPHGRPSMLQHPAFDFAKRAFAPHGPYMKRQPAFPAFKFKGNFQQASTQVEAQDSCGEPITPPPAGLPSAPCGTNFDANLDKAEGYLNFTSVTQFASSLKELAPNLPDYQQADYINGPKEIGKPTPPPPGRRSYEHHELVERGLFGALGAWFASAIQTVVDVVASAASIVLDAVKQVAQFIGEAVSAILEEIGRFIVKGVVSIFGPEVSVNLPIKANAASNSDSSFGRATKFYSKTGKNENGTSASITLYCVRCGVNGEIVFFGKFEFKPGTSKLDVGEVGIMGSITGRLVLGLEAQFRQEFKHKEMLVEVGLPGFSIPKLISVGPVATLSAAAYLDVYVKGNVQAGAEISVGPFASVINLLSPGHAGIQNFTITKKPVFSAEAKIDTYLKLGLPLSVGFGVVIPIAKFEKTASIVEEPYVTANLAYTIGKKYVNYDLYLGNRLSSNIFDLDEHTISEIRLATFASGQIPIPGLTKRDANFENLIDSTPFESTTYVDGNLDNYMLGPEKFLNLKREKKRAEEANPMDDPKIPPETPAEQSSDFPVVNKMALAEARMYQANPNGASVEKFGFTFTQIFDSTGNYHLSNEDNGNFGLKPATTSNMTDGGLEFEVYKDMVVSDYGLRLFHFYEKELAAYQVSRFRLADPQKVPVDAKIVILQAFDIAELMGTPASNITDPLVYLAVDTAKTVYFPIVCSYSDGQASKLFLATNAETGPIILMDPDLQHSVTGGIVQECLFVPFVQNGGPGDEFGTGLNITHPPR